MTTGTLELLEPEEISAVVGRWKANDAQFSKALQLGISTAQALDRLGVRLCLRERYPEALAVLDAALVLSPNNRAILNNLAVVQERAGLTDQAIGTVQRSLALCHHQPDSWLFLGNMKRMRGNLEGAQDAYEATLALEPNSPLAWQGLGHIRQEQHKYLEAIECFTTCIQQSHPTAPLLAILGHLFYATGQYEKSHDAYAAALQCDGQNPRHRRMRREMQFVCSALHGDSLEGALEAYQIDRSAYPDTEDKDIGDLLLTAFSLLSAYHHHDAARRVGEKHRALFPANPTVAYLLHALDGDSSIPRSPDAYLVEYFDKFAGGFDHKLVNMLGYDIPRKLGAVLSGLVPPGARVDVLDAGCGTGLCGPWIRDFSASLTGVDLSPGMLEHARRRQIYDRLVCAELTSLLTDAPSIFDIIIAADVMIYFGDLAPLAAALVQSLKSGGLLAFSTERAVASGHQLLSSGRFAHHPDYVHSIFKTAFEACIFQDTTIRLEAAQPVAGNIFVFRRRGTG